MRFHSKESGVKRGLRVWTLAIIGGLLALLMVAAASCSNGEPQPNPTLEPTSASTSTSTPAPTPTETSTLTPTDTPMPTSSPTARLTPTPETTPSPSPVKPPSTPTTKEDVHSILQAAVEAMREVDSFRFVESRSRGVSNVAAGDAEATFEARGDYQSPDRLHKRAVFRDIHTPTASHIQSMSFSDNRLVTDPATGEWKESEDSGWPGEYLFGNPIDFFESVVPEFGPDAYRGITTLAGVRVHRLAYNTPDSEPRSAVITSLDVEILVGVDDSLVREMRRRSSWKQRPCPLDQECLAIEIIPGCTSSKQVGQKGSL